MSSSTFSFKHILISWKLPLTVTALLFILELALRGSQWGWTAVWDWYHYNPNGFAYSNLVIDDALMGWRIRPNLDDFFKGKKFRSNSDGLRADREFPLIKPEKRLRIAVVGRSYSMGAGVANGEVWTDRLQQQFDRDNRSIEMLNFSVSGHSLMQSIANLRHRVINYDPDWIILTVLHGELEKNNVTRSTTL